MSDWRTLQDDCLRDMVSRKFGPRTRGQARYFASVQTLPYTLCTGPAGTGKTYVPCGVAAGLLREKKVARIVLTRPIVTCSGRRRESPIGYLPGSLLEKIGPHMVPMLDALEDFFSPQDLNALVEQEKVELVPLDFMRGRSLRDAFVIADEMQNCEKDQFLMLLTRLGQNSRLVASGDVTQTDLPGPASQSALAHALRVFRGEDAFGLVRLTEKDIVRSPHIARILECWER